MVFQGPLASFPSESDHLAEVLRSKSNRTSVDPLAAFSTELETSSAVLPFTATKRKTSIGTMMAAAGFLGVATAALPFTLFIGRSTTTAAAPVQSERVAPTTPSTPIDAPPVPVADKRDEPQPVGTSGVAVPVNPAPVPPAAGAKRRTAGERLSTSAQGGPGVVERRRVRRAIKAPANRRTRPSANVARARER